MPNYNNTVIYKIVCKDETIIDNYIGHTTDFRARILQHKNRCNNMKDIGYNIYLYQIIRANGGWDNWSMIMIEEYSCNDKNEASIRERYWIENLKSSLNTEIPSRTKKEYQQQNAEKLKEYRKEYCKQNAEKLKEYQQKNAEKIREQKKEYYEQNAEKIREQKKEYYEQNKHKNAEKLKEKEKKYRQQNAEKIEEKRKQKITCECGCVLRKDTLRKHQQSQKHKDLLEKLISNEAVENSAIHS
jgi:hypothetical protein